MHSPSLVLLDLSPPTRSDMKSLTIEVDVDPMAVTIIVSRL